MLKLIVGNKGSGKTKALLEMVDRALAATNGAVVVVEKGSVMTYTLNHKARLVDIDEYDISGFQAFYGFIAGLFAGNYDITDMFVDASLRIGGRNLEEFAQMILKLENVLAKNNACVLFTVSCGPEELPESIQRFTVDF